MTLQTFSVFQQAQDIRLTMEGKRHQWTLNSKEMEELVVELRRDLDAICHEYLNFPCETNGHRDVDKLRLLQDLAASGSNLRNKVFGQSASQIQALLRSADGVEMQCQFLLLHDDVKFYIPWGLMFDMESPDLATNLSEPELMNGFWCMKHNVSVVHATRYEGALDGHPTIDIKERGLFGIFHPGPLQTALRYDDHPWPADLCIVSRRELKRHFLEGSAHCLLYFLCHANGDVLQLSNSKDDDVNPGMFRAWSSSTPARARRGLFILNGCGTATQRRKGETWLRVTHENGFLGFIGTEATVPTGFAWNFGRDLLRLILLDGLNPVQAMQSLRRDHWPLSLLYALYCVPDVHATVHDVQLTGLFARPGAANYSRLNFTAGGRDETLWLRGSM
jgi:hypothetical protein